MRSKENQKNRHGVFSTSFNYQHRSTSNFAWKQRKESVNNVFEIVGHVQGSLKVKGLWKSSRLRSDTEWFFQLNCTCLPRLSRSLSTVEGDRSMYVNDCSLWSEWEYINYTPVCGHLILDHPNLRVASSSGFFFWPVELTPLLNQSHKPKELTWVEKQAIYEVPKNYFVYFPLRLTPTFQVSPVLFAQRSLCDWCSWITW